MPAVAQGAKPLCPAVVFASRINTLSEDAEIMDQERAAMFGHTINDLRHPAQPSAHEPSRRRGCRKVTLRGFPSGPMAQVPISPPLAPTVSGVEPAAAGLSGGLGHVDHLVCGDGGIAEGHGRSEERRVGKGWSGM